MAQGQPVNLDFSQDQVEKFTFKRRSFFKILPGRRFAKPERPVEP